MGGKGFEGWARRFQWWWDCQHVAQKILLTPHQKTIYNCTTHIPPTPLTRTHSLHLTIGKGGSAQRWAGRGSKGGREDFSGGGTVSTWLRNSAHAPSENYIYISAQHTSLPPPQHAPTACT